MIYFFGLGNPGEKYNKTRHNAGFMFINFLAEKLWGLQVKFSEQSRLWAQTLKEQNLLLAKPTTFMNESGQAVQAVTAYYKDGAAALGKNLVVVHDDLDLELGTCKLQFGRGPKTHNGLQSVYQVLKTDQFWHLRLGIDSRGGDRSIPPSNYVLAKMTKDDLIEMKQSFVQAAQLLQQQDLLN